MDCVRLFSAGGGLAGKEHAVLPQQLPGEDPLLHGWGVVGGNSGPSGRGQERTQHGL